MDQIYIYKNGTLTTFGVENFSDLRLNFYKSPYYSFLPDNIMVGFLFKSLYIFYYNMSESDPTEFGMRTLTINLEGEY